MKEGPSHPGPCDWWWLSFCDKDKPKGNQFLGVVVVRGATLRAAMKRAWDLKINPGGEVLASALSQAIPSERWRERLLSAPECEAANAEKWETLH